MLDLTTLTQLHTVISMLAVLLGAVILVEMLGIALPAPVTNSFLLLAFLTSATGFLFPLNGVLPSHVVGAVALLILAAAVYARHGGHLLGRWRGIYAVSVVASVYLLMFVGVAQMFTKIPAFQLAAPTQSEPPFLVAQLVLLAAFLVIRIAAVRQYRPDGARMSASHVMPG
jgi:uncharacterized membrane protein